MCRRAPVVADDAPADDMVCEHHLSGIIDRDHDNLLGRLSLAGGQLRQQVTPNLQDVRRLPLDLQPWSDTQTVRELDEHFAAVGGTQ